MRTPYEVITLIQRVFPGAECVEIRMHREPCPMCGVAPKRGTYCCELCEADHVAYLRAIARDERRAA